MDVASPRQRFPNLESTLRSTGFGPSFQQADVHVLEIRRPGAGTRDATHEWLLIEKQQDAEYDQTGRTVHRAALRIYYWDLHADPLARDTPNGEFNAYYESHANAISITSGALYSGGYVIIEPIRLRGCGVGTYLMNLVVLWARQWPHAQVCEINLLDGDARHPDNRARRNQFYRQFGIEFDFKAGADEAIGTSRPMTVGQLVPRPGLPDTMTEHALVPYLRRRINDVQDSLAEQRFLQRELRKASDELADAYDGPVRWMLHRTILDHPLRSLLVLTMIVVIVLSWQHLP